MNKSIDDVITNGNHRPWIIGVGLVSWSGLYAVIRPTLVELGTDSRFVLSCAAGMLFGIWYNRQIEQFRKKGKQERQTAYTVGVGFLANLAFLLIGVGARAEARLWQFLMLMLMTFIATGVPMTWGDRRRHEEAREVVIPLDELRDE